MWNYLEIYIALFRIHLTMDIMIFGIRRGSIVIIHRRLGLHTHKRIWSKLDRRHQVLLTFFAITPCKLESLSLKSTQSYVSAVSSVSLLRSTESFLLVARWLLHINKCEIFRSCSSVRTVCFFFLNPDDFFSTWLDCWSTLVNDRVKDERTTRQPNRSNRSSSNLVLPS